MVDCSETVESWADCPELLAKTDGGVEAAVCWSSFPEPPTVTDGWSSSPEPSAETGHFSWSCAGLAAGSTGDCGRCSIALLRGAGMGAGTDSTPAVPTRGTDMDTGSSGALAVMRTGTGTGLVQGKVRVQEYAGPEPSSEQKQVEER